MDDALDKAIGVFREHGFHATSVSDLTEAMALASGSIYKAFKDKRAVFLAAFDRYTSLRNEQARRVAAAGKTGIERLRDVLAFYVKSSQGAEGRRGCLVVGSAVEMAVFDPEIAARVTATLKNEADPAGSVRRLDLARDRRREHGARDGLPDPGHAGRRQERPCAAGRIHCHRHRHEAAHLVRKRCRSAQIYPAN